MSDMRKCHKCDGEFDLDAEGSLNNGIPVCQECLEAEDEDNEDEGA